MRRSILPPSVSSACEAAVSADAERLRAIVARARPRLTAIAAADAARRPAATSWSKQEILGHLIDSAANNHQRFVRAGLDAEVRLPATTGRDGCGAQDYATAEWPALVELWAAYNRHLAHVLERIPSPRLSVPCRIGDAEPVPLQALIGSYVEHLLHHLQAIEPELRG
jgi:hypothetical protein